MLAALGTLGSAYIPKLISFGAKKLMHSPLGNLIRKVKSHPVGN